VKKILNQVIERTLFRVLDTYVENNLVPKLTNRFYDNIDFHQRQKAMESSAAFAAAHFQSARPFADRLQGLGYAIQQAKNPGLFLEFGVASGASINFIAANTKAIVHGFDSFEGYRSTGVPELGPEHFENHQAGYPKQGRMSNSMLAGLRTACHAFLPSTMKTSLFYI
jgi:hypothetical protein